MTIRESMAWASEMLEAARVENPRIDAEYLVGAVSGIPRPGLVLRGDQALSPASIQRLQRWVTRRANRKPLAYILGEQPFYGRSYQVTPNVLIPRPETELLVERALELLAGPEKHVIIDVGTGSGNIAITLAQEIRTAKIYAVDLLSSALRVAKKNARMHGAENRIEWLRGDLLEPVIQRKIVPDLILANLPYVRLKEFAGLQPEVHYEPRVALNGGKDGLELIRRCVAQASDVLPGGGRLLMEIGAGQERAVQSLFSSSRAWTRFACVKDLSGLPRIVDVEKDIA